MVDYRTKFLILHRVQRCYWSQNQPIWYDCFHLRVGSQPKDENSYIMPVLTGGLNEKTAEIWVFSKVIYIYPKFYCDSAFIYN